MSGLEKVDIHIDAPKIAKILNLKKRKNKKGKVITWKNFGELLEALRDKQFEHLLEKERGFVSNVIDSEDIKCLSQKQKNFIVYKKIEDVFSDFPIEVTNKSFSISDDDCLGHCISMIKAGRYTKKIAPFLAWLWRNYESDVYQFYCDLGLKKRADKHKKQIMGIKEEDVNTTTPHAVQIKENPKQGITDSNEQRLEIVDISIAEQIAKKLSYDFEYSYITNGYSFSKVQETFKERTKILNEEYPSEQVPSDKYHDFEKLKNFIFSHKQLSEEEVQTAISELKSDLGKTKLIVSCSSINSAIIITLDLLRKEGVPIDCDWDATHHLTQWNAIKYRDPDFCFTTEGTYHLTGMVKRGIYNYKPILPISGIKHLIIYKKNPKKHGQPNHFKRLYSLVDSSAHAEEIILKPKYAQFFGEFKKLGHFEDLSKFYKQFDDLHYDEAINIWEPVGSFLLSKHKNAAVFKFNTLDRDPYVSLVNLMAKEKWLTSEHDKVRYNFLKLFIHQWNALAGISIKKSFKIYTEIPNAYTNLNKAFGLSRLDSFEQAYL